IAPFDLKILGEEDVEVLGIECDSRKVKNGDIFVAIKGEHFDGTKFASEAEKNGAKSILTEREIKDTSLPQVIVEEVSKVLGNLSARFYLEPTKEMKVLGITGTNGKTTVAYLTESIFKSARVRGGGAVIGTINYRYDGKVFDSEHTTPEAHNLQRFFKEIADAGITHCAVEVSSHALTQRRVDGTNFQVKVFTNLTPEHLDYHHTIEEYYKAKSRLFTDKSFDSSSNVRDRGLVINADDPYGRRIIKESKEALTYSLDSSGEASIYPKSFTVSSSGISALVATPKGTLNIESTLVGEYNLQNILAAIGAGIALGFSTEVISAGINNLKKVPGRLEAFKGGSNISAFVDYAHTPDALEKTLKALKPLTKARIITVFGCGGDRDKIKRGVMGEVATRLSDITIITSDNPRTEDPLMIISDIEGGIKEAKKYETSKKTEEKTYLIIPDRKEAIERAVEFARSGDLVLIAGKGHEDYQIVGSKKFLFDDREILKNCLDKARAAS
ncbi:MAG: UDP-N-acetylmuramoyl-L-alanyl-D-glutamate--2,6-diaminopimelate ligase, partial [Deltaproteobacteria bacterium]|nr:UDP-N-acetylmuramoyl-L-alanyl-D-glutamate--2,6-diaminopimelate ligase [Deltaproteobacteria bacterium]